MRELLPPGLVARDELTSATRDEMFDLLSKHFDGVTRPQFEQDLAEKNWIVEIRRDGLLLGFSTLRVTEATFEGRTMTVIYSGDTIVSPEGWRSPALPRTWIAAVNYLRAENSARPCYWLLLTSGFRTYRFLPVFWREFIPRHGAVATPHLQRLLDHLAHAHYGDHFNQSAGLVRFPNPQRLRHRLPEGREADPDVAFFLARNPGYTDGDELVCLTEISESNLTAAGRRMVAE